jgi:mono/diheme cytochrome c family protein
MSIIVQRFGGQVIGACVVCASLVIGPFVARAQEPSRAAGPTTAEARAASLEQFERAVEPFLVQHCAECHNAKHAGKELNLLQLEPDMKLTTSGARWAMVLEKLEKGEMPPPDKARPSADELHAVSAWIRSELNRSGLRLARRTEYENGNRVPHELLFDPRPSAALDAAARIRPPSPQIYEAFLNELGKGIPGLGQPFSPDGKSTFKDSGDPPIDEPITAMLIRNALAIVDKQTAHKLENGELKGVGGTPREFLALLDESKEISDEHLAAAITLQFDRVLKRPPTDEELARFRQLFQKNVADAGRILGAKTTLAAVLLLPEAVFRWEVGGGLPDAYGRVRLAPREIAYALAYALTDRRPDGWLLAEAAQGKLDTQQGVAAAVRKMLADPKLEKPRIARFFREYFQYDQAEEVFKNDKENPEHDARALIEDTDRLVAYILEQDQNVLRELLTTNKSFVAYKTAAETKKKRAEELARFQAQAQKDPPKFKDKKPPQSGRSIYQSYNLSDFPDQQPVELPAEQRAGILTQPSWLVAFSKSDENHAILRGKWVRERLLGGVVPDIPITVDAQLPNDPSQTLRQRMAVTRQEYCWKCHTLMNPLGLPFEMYDHFGRYRTAEQVLDVEATAGNVDAKGKSRGPVFRAVPIDATGRVEHTADPNLEGDTRNAIELVKRLADSQHVERVFVRHAFRYWMGRNETLGDAASLQAAHKAYRESGGSMKALIIALLTSDSFLYRAAVQDRGGEPSNQSFPSKPASSKGG